MKKKSPPTTIATTTASRTDGSSSLRLSLLSAFACGDDDDGANGGDSGKGGSSAGKGGGSAAGKGGGNAGSSSGGKGGSSGMFDPEACAPMMMQQVDMLPPGCTQAEVDDYADCLSDSCEPTLEKCYGPDYQSGEFSGACKEQLDCATKECSCDDTGCLSACPGADTCASCFLNNRCGLDCKLPKCAIEGSLGDSGIDFDRTCDDVLACCATLAAAQKDQCTMAINAIKAAAGASADLGCSPLFALYAMGSSDPACK